MLARMPGHGRHNGNALLRSLTAGNGIRLIHKLELRQLRAHESLADRGHRASHYYFPIGAVISTKMRMNDGARVEIRTIGCEGMLGHDDVFGLQHRRFEVTCQVPGDVLRIPAKIFNAEIRRNGNWRQVLDRYALTVFSFSAQSIACNGLHSIAQRCARWLLITRDRVNHDRFHLTHEALAAMLGVRRSGVSVAVKALQDSGLIEYKRGNMQLLRSRELERHSCECYRVAARESARLMSA